MTNRFLSSLPAFTLESLMTNDRWAVVQAAQQKKQDVKPNRAKKADPPGQPANRAKTIL